MGRSILVSYTATFSATNSATANNIMTISATTITSAATKTAAKPATTTNVKVDNENINKASSHRSLYFAPQRKLHFRQNYFP